MRFTGQPMQMAFSEHTSPLDRNEITSFGHHVTDLTSLKVSAKCLPLLTNFNDQISYDTS